MVFFLAGFEAYMNHDPPCCRIKNCAEAKARLNEWLGEEDYNTMTLMMKFFLLVQFICRILARWDERDDDEDNGETESVLHVICSSDTCRLVTTGGRSCLLKCWWIFEVGSAEGLQNKREPSLTLIIKTIKSSCMK